MKKSKALTELNIDKPEEPYIEPANSATSILSYEVEYRIIQSKISDLLAAITDSQNSNTPFFVFNVRKRNEKIKLNYEAQVLMLNQIQNLREISEQLLEMRADEIYGPEHLKNLVEAKYELSKQYFEDLIATHKLKMATIGTDIVLTKSKVDFDELAKERKRIENRQLLANIEGTEADNNLKNAQAEKIRAEAELIRGKSQVDVTKINMIKKAMEEINIAGFPAAFKTFIFTSFLNYDISQMTQFEIQEKMKEFIFQQAKAESDKKTAETEDFINSAEFKKWQFERDKKSAEKNDRL